MMMLLLVFSFLSSITLTVGLDSANVTCTTDDPCHTITCPSNVSSCDIYCQGMLSCSNISIDCNNAVSCKLECFNQNSCSQTIINGLETQTLDIYLWTNNTSAAAAPPGANMNIICPINKSGEKSDAKCTVHCNPGRSIYSKSCYNLIIYSQQGS